MRLAHGLFAVSACAVTACGLFATDDPAPMRRSHGTGVDDAPDAAVSADASSTPPTSPSDAPDAGASDPCAGTALCDGFEDQDVGSAPTGTWSVGSLPHGTVVVDDAKAYRGQRSVRVSTDGAGQYKSALFSTKTPSALATIVYGRMMIWLDHSAGDGVHWTMVSGSGPLGGMNGVTGLYRYGGMHQGRLMANYETLGRSTDCWKESATLMPTKKWTCITWRFDATQNEMRMSLDGQEVSDLTVKERGAGCVGDDLGGVWQAPAFDTLSVGWESYQPDTAQTAWIDEVAVGPQPIACPPP